MVRMPKKKLKKQSDKALRSQVKKEQAPARSAESSPRDDVNESDLPIVPRSPKEKAMRNRWLAFLTVVAVIAIALAHRGGGDDADSGTSYEVVAGRGLDLHATFSQIKSGS